MRPRDRRAAALLAAGAALRLCWLTRPSLWSDEASTLLHASLPLAGLLGQLRRTESTPPLHFALIHFWLKALPDGVLALRSFSWACGVAALALFWRLARRLAPGRELWCLGAAALCASWVHASQDGRCYALFLALSLGCALAAWELSRRPSRRWSALYGLLAGAGVATHYFFVFSIAADAAFLALAGDRRGRRLQAAAFVAPALTGLALVPFARGQLTSWPGAALLSRPMTPSYAAQIVGHLFADPWYLGLAFERTLEAVGWALLAFLAAAAARAWRASEARPRLLFAWLHFALAFPLVRVVELVLGTALTQGRYFIAGAPFLLVLLVESCAVLPRRARLACGAALAAGLTAGLGAYLYCAGFVDPRLEALAAALRRGTPSSEPIVHLSSFYYEPLRYYYLPERAHFLLEGPAAALKAAALPGYPAVITAAQLSRHPTWTVVDPEGTLLRDKIGRATGAQLASRLR